MLVFFSFFFFFCLNDLQHQRSHKKVYVAELKSKIASKRDGYYFFKVSFDMNKKTCNGFSQVFKIVKNKNNNDIDSDSDESSSLSDDDMYKAEHIARNKKRKKTKWKNLRKKKFFVCVRCSYCGIFDEQSKTRKKDCKICLTCGTYQHIKCRQEIDKIFGNQEQKECLKCMDAQKVLNSPLGERYYTNTLRNLTRKVGYKESALTVGDENVDSMDSLNKTNVDDLKKICVNNGIRVPIEATQFSYISVFI